MFNANAQTGGLINGAMPSYRGIIGVEEMRELVQYLYSLRPPGATAKPGAW